MDSEFKVPFHLQLFFHKDVPLLDVPLLDSPSDEGKVVAHLKHLPQSVDGENPAIVIVFVDLEFPGSTIHAVAKEILPAPPREWSIDGGTGLYTDAEGVIHEILHIYPAPGGPPHLCLELIKIDGHHSLKIPPQSGTDIPN